MHAAYSVCTLYLPYLRASSGEFFHGDITVLVYTVLHIAYCWFWNQWGWGGFQPQSFGMVSGVFFVVFFETVSFWYWGFCWGLVR